MGNKLFLSIIIPVYNMEEYILPCIESILQNYSSNIIPYEIIIVDDGSNDRTFSIVNQYIVNHPQDNHIQLISQKNSGVSAARNTGLNHACGQFVWFIDGDDIITQDALSLLWEVENKDLLDVIKIGACVDKDLSGKVAIHKSNADKNAFFHLSPFILLSRKFDHGHTTYIWKRNFLEINCLRYPETITQNEDFCFVTQALLKAQLAYVNLSYNFYIYRIRDYSSSRGHYDYARMTRYLDNKLKVIDVFSNIDLKNPVKQRYFTTFMNYYSYTSLCDCIVKKCPLSKSLSYLRELATRKLYPVNAALLKEDLMPNSFKARILNVKLFFILVHFLYKFFIPVKRI